MVQAVVLDKLVSGRLNASVLDVLSRSRNARIEVAVEWMKDCAASRGQPRYHAVERLVGLLSAAELETSLGFLGSGRRQILTPMKRALNG